MNRIQELREEKGLNRKQAAAEIGMAYTTYISYENGAREMKSEVLQRFAEFFGVSVDYLVGRTDDRTPNTEDPDGDLNEIREAMRTRPDVRFLMHLAMGGRVSDVLEASAVLQRLKEESENK